MALNQLIDIYNVKGEEFLQKLLSLPVTIYEKMDGCDFSFEKIEGKFVFFKKNTDLPINKIDRLIVKMYEPAISYFESLPSVIKKQIPEKVRFGFEYFPTKSPNLICYDRIPKNHLIISYIKDLASKEVISDKEELVKIAKVLEVEPPSILFQGNLTDEQKVDILEFIKTSKKDLDNKYKGKSFTEILITIINPSLKKTILNNDLSKMIEGVIFSFDNGKNKAYAKIIDPVFSDIMSKNKDAEKSDTLHIILSDMIEFMEIQKGIWRVYKFKKIDFDERYIEIISMMFNRFIRHCKDRYKDLNLTTPKFLQAPEFNVNPYFLDNTKTIELISTNQRYGELFKIFIALFRKKKRKLAEFISPVVIKYQNQIVDDLADKLKEGNENSFPTFEQFYSIFGTEKENFLNDDTILFEEIDKSINDNKLILEQIKVERINESNHLQMISFWQEAFSTKIEKAEIKKSIPVALMIGKFQPFNNKHLKELNDFKEKNKKVVIIQVNNDVTSKRTPFNKKLSESMFSKLREGYSSTIEDVIIIKEFDFKKALKKLNREKSYKVEEIICNENYFKQISKQLKYYEISEDLNIEFNLRCFDKNQDAKSNSQKIIDSLLEDNISSFKRLVPKEIQILYNNFKEALKSKE